MNPPTSSPYTISFSNSVIPVILSHISVLGPRNFQGQKSIPCSLTVWKGLTVHLRCGYMFATPQYATGGECDPSLMDQLCWLLAKISRSAWDAGAPCLRPPLTSHSSSLGCSSESLALFTSVPSDSSSVLFTHPCLA